LTTTNIINDELRAFVDPLTEIERAALERSLLAEGCRDALVLWRDVLIDGHNRYEICRRTASNSAPSRTTASRRSKTSCCG
jgi:hypothetical protein